MVADMMRTAACIDNNQKGIVKALRKMGFSVAVCSAMGKGFTDLVVAKNNITMLVEIKNEKGKLTPAQVTFHAEWGDEICVAKTVDNVLAFYLKKLKERKK